MAYSALDARRTHKKDRMYGGAIKSVEGGYTYAKPVVAPSRRPLEVRYRIGRDDVARYHVYPQAVDIRERRSREHVSTGDQISVNESDPLHRPVYFLTPKLVVKAYRGGAIPEQAIARLDSEHRGMSMTLIASSEP